MGSKPTWNDTLCHQQIIVLNLGVLYKINIEQLLSYFGGVAYLTVIRSKQRREQEVRVGRGRGGSSQRNGERGGDYQQWQESPEVRVTFTVSNLKCGLIIGRGQYHENYKQDYPSLIQKLN